MRLDTNVSSFFISRKNVMRFMSSIEYDFKNYAGSIWRNESVPEISNLLGTQVDYDKHIW